MEQIECVRVPPHSDEAEMSLVGCMVMDAYRTVDAMTKAQVSPKSFYQPRNEVLAEMLVGMVERGARVDVVLVLNQLKTAGKLEEIGGEQYLIECIDRVPTIEHVEDYIDAVRQKFVARAVIDAARKVTEDAYQAEDPEKLLKSAPQAFIEIIGHARSDESNDTVMRRTIGEWEEAAAGGKKAVGISTPWNEITTLMCGYEPGITIGAGRPSAGKTTMEGMQAIHAAIEGKRVLRITMDSTRRELLSRSICCRAGVSLPKMKFGFGTRKQLADCHEQREIIAALPMTIEDRTWDVRHICTLVRQAKIRDDIQLVTIDYLQQVQDAESMKRGFNDNARFTRIMARLKELSFDVGIPFLILSQLSREVEKEGREPRLSDLRDSGSIEQDADKVWFLYRNVAKCNEMDEQNAGATKHKRALVFNLMKHKGGETARIEMWMYPPYFRFEVAGENWADDALPGSYKEDSKAFDKQPVFLPADEGITHPAKHAKEEQIELPVEDEDDA